MINLQAKQIASLDYTRLDNATLLSAVDLMSQHVQHSQAARTKLGTIADTFVSAVTAYDEAYNPSQKDLLTDVLFDLDKVRDKAQTAWHENILAAQRSPNEQKAMVARQLVQLYKDYKLETADEYMKQTTNIRQMIQAIQADATIMAALPTMGLDDYLTDLDTKNEAFATKMAERTAGTVGREKGVVAAARTEVERRLRDLIRATNVVSIYEGDGGLDSFIDTINAEVEHYKDILARKGVSSGSSSNSGNSSNSGTTPSGGGSEQGGSEQGGSEQGGSEQGGGLPPSGGGEVGDDNGGSSENGGSGDNGGGLPPSGGGEVGDNSGGGGLPGSGGEG